MCALVSVGDYTDDHRPTFFYNNGRKSRNGGLATTVQVLSSLLISDMILSKSHLSFTCEMEALEATDK